MFKSIFFKLIMLVFFINGSVAWGANLVKNGNFEAGKDGWTEWSNQSWATGVFAHDYVNGSTVWSPEPYPYDGEHTHSQSYGGNNIHGGLYQVINVTKGRKYTVSGQWSGGVGGLVPDSKTIAAWFEFTIYDGVASVAQIDAAPGDNDVTLAKREYSYDGITGKSVYSFGWETFEGTFTAQSNQVTLALKTGRLGDWDAIAAYHDNILVYEFHWPMFVPATTSRGVEETTP